MAPAGLADLARQVLTLERAVALDIVTTGELSGRYPPAENVLASLREELAGMPDALEGALQGLGEAGVAETTARPASLPGEDATAVEALASLGGRLTRVALTCAALHAVAHRAYASAGDGNLADLAEAHMLSYLTAAAAIGEVLAEVAVWQLEQTGLECLCHCSACSAGICICARHGKETVAKVRLNASTRPGEEGIAVRRPPAGSRAALAGLQPGDVILAAAGQPTPSPIDLLRAIRDVPAGADVALTIRRGDTTTEVLVSPA
jgi:hypothetical protein